jgi:hypothetical protein
MKHREAPSLASADEAVVATLQQTDWLVAGHPHSAGSDLERVTCQSQIMKLTLTLITGLLLAPLAALHAADAPTKKPNTVSYTHLTLPTSP